RRVAEIPDEDCGFGNSLPPSHGLLDLQSAGLSIDDERDRLDLFESPVALGSIDVELIEAEQSAFHHGLRGLIRVDRAACTSAVGIGSTGAGTHNVTHRRGKGLCADFPHGLCSGAQCPAKCFQRGLGAFAEADEDYPLCAEVLARRDMKNRDLARPTGELAALKQSLEAARDRSVNRGGLIPEWFTFPMAEQERVRCLITESSGLHDHVHLCRHVLRWSPYTPRIAGSQMSLCT